MILDKKLSRCISNICLNNTTLIRCWLPVSQIWIPNQRGGSSLFKPMQMLSSSNPSRAFGGTANFHWWSLYCLFSLPWDSSKHFYSIYGVFQVQLWANGGQFTLDYVKRAVQWQIPIIPRELPVLHNMDWPRHWWKILWLTISKTSLADMSELTVGTVFTSQWEDNAGFPALVIIRVPGIYSR